MNIQDWLGKDNELGIQIWKDKYQFEDETFDEWLERVSKGNKEVKQLIIDKKFLFGGRILANRGLDKLGRKVTYSNCYVLEKVPDSIEGIYETAKQLARTFSYGGGVGIDISNLRPKGSPVNNAAKTTTGAVSFMETFSNVSSVIGQEGRRGALMISMDCNHQDIEDFIDAKKNTDKLEGCNISVRVDDEFMNKVLDKESLQYELFMKLAKNNWDYAEPGILYWDTINNYNLLSEYIKHNEFEFAGVNPCAEEPLPAGGSCLLGAINLAEYVENPYTDKAAFNLAEFKTDVKKCIRALNEVLDEGLTLHPLEIQQQSVNDWRQIGLGIMGFGTMLIKMKVQYGSDRCLKIIQTIGTGLVDSGLLASSEIAEKLGAFPKYDEDRILQSNFIQNLPITGAILNHIKDHGLRNSQLFTIAPTGSISTMLQVTGGVEPMFNYKYWRKTKSLNGGEETYYEVIDPVVLEAMKHEENKEQIPEYVVWAGILNPEYRVLTQGQWQRFIDASISSTVNLNNEATVEEVAKLYHQAWVAGCKGLTIFRDGCARMPILSTNKEESEQEQEEVKEIDTSIENCTAKGTKLQTGCGSLWVTAYFHNQTGQLCHLFLDKGSTGGCNSFMVGLSRTISLLGRNGVALEDIIEQLKSSVSCPSYIVRSKMRKDTSPGTCCPAAIGNALLKLKEEFDNEKHYAKEQVKEQIKEEVKQNTSKCPECGEAMASTGGCNICLNCGWSKCQ